MQETVFQRMKGGIPPRRLAQDANRAATLVKLAKKL
jgi:hypothetical protein